MPPSEKHFNDLSARVTKVADDATTLSTRLTRIEASLGVVKTICVTVVGIFFGAAIGIVVYSGRLAERIAHLEGEKGDPLGATLNGIQPSLPDKNLSANLSLLAAQLRVDMQAKKKPKGENLVRVSTAVRQVAYAKPDLPAVWDAAFSLVTYRSKAIRSQVQSDLPDCLGNPSVAAEQVRNTPETEGMRDGSITLFFVVEGCTLDLDLKPDYSGSGAAEFFREISRRYPKMAHAIDIRNALISYSGGPMIPIDGLRFANCMFDLSTPSSTPPKSGQSLTEQLLMSDLTAASIKLPNGM